MPKLLIVTTVPVTLSAFLLPFAHHYRERGWRVDAAAHDATARPEIVAAFDRVWDVAWTRNPLDPRNLLGASRALRELVAEEGYDLVHVHTPVAAFVTRFVLRRARRRGGPAVVYTAHGFHFFPGGPRLRNAAFLALEKVAGRWTDALVVINRDDERLARRFRLVPPERLTAMPGIGVDPARYDPAAVPPGEVEAVRRSLSLAPGDPLFLLLAELIPRKHPEDPVRALALLGRPEAHLALAGGGLLLDPTRRLAAELGVRDRVHFLGFRDDVPALVLAAAAVLLVSAQEGLPRSVMEALCLEAPVIGTDIRGTRDLLEGDCGILVPVGDPARLADAMRRVLDDPAGARAMGRRGRAKMLGGYRQQAILERHDALYAAVLAARNSGAVPIPRGREAGRRVKRAVDVAVALAGLVACAPVMAAAAAAVRVAMGRPVLFRQVRPGYRGKPFLLYKFRTMRDAVAPDGRRLTEAERLTRLGWFLRRTSLDELPQLWNVLKGDISLVGPRPLLVEYLPYYTERERLRHSVRPGITGLAQVSGRNALSWEERLELDVRYVERWSLWLDVRILVGTVRSVLSASGVARDPAREGALHELRREASAAAPDGGAAADGPETVARAAPATPAPDDAR